MKKHCKTFNRENKIHRVKVTSYPDPYQNKTDPKHWKHGSVTSRPLKNYDRPTDRQTNRQTGGVIGKRFLQTLPGR